MRVIGITGKYCAGKNTAAEILAEYGYLDIDVDRFGHEALRSEAARVIERFGSVVAAGSGEIDRHRLAEIVFADSRALADLESLIHPVMVSAVKRRIGEYRASDPRPAGVVVNAAVLFRMGLSRLCDTVVYVHASFIVRCARARERDHVGFREILRRLGAQRDVAPQFSGPDADIQSVRNDGSPEQLRAKLVRLLGLSSPDGDTWSSTKSFSSS